MKVPTQSDWARQGKLRDRVCAQLLSPLTECSQLLSTKAFVTEPKQIQEMLLKTVNGPEHFNELALGRKPQMTEPRRDLNDLLHSMGRREEYKAPRSENS